MHHFLKTQLALIAGSMADFTMTVLLVEAFHCWYIAGNAAGNVTGALAQFLLSRNWVFSQSKQQNTSSQVIKFMLMWVSNLALAALGVFLLTNFLHLHYLLSKTIVSVTLGLSYTYFVSKKFVFV